MKDSDIIFISEPLDKKQKEQVLQRFTDGKSFYHLGIKTRKADPEKSREYFEVAVKCFNHALRCIFGADARAKSKSYEEYSVEMKKQDRRVDMLKADPQSKKIAKAIYLGLVYAYIKMEKYKKAIKELNELEDIVHIKEKIRVLVCPKCNYHIEDLSATQCPMCRTRRPKKAEEEEAEIWHMP